MKLWRVRLSVWLHELADFTRPEPAKFDQDCCPMCGINGRGGCSICGSMGCDNGCRSPHGQGIHHFLDDQAVGRPNDEGRCPDCGAHPAVWTHYGGVALGNVGAPKRPWRARRGWKTKTEKELIQRPW